MPHNVFLQCGELSYSVTATDNFDLTFFYPLTSAVYETYLIFEYKQTGEQLHWPLPEVGVSTSNCSIYLDPTIINNRPSGAGDDDTA